MDNPGEEMTNRLLKILVESLARAVKEIREHNAEYHHHTPEVTLAEWDELIAKVRKNL